MQVIFSTTDRDLANRISRAFDDFFAELGRRTEQDMVRLRVTSGLMVAEVWHKDGTRAVIPMGLRPLAAAVASGPDTIRRYVDQLLAWSRKKQMASRSGLILAR